VAETYGLRDKQIVSVKVEGERAVVFGQTVIRINASFAPAMHVDVDEFNAAGLSGAPMGEVIV